ncbi:MAG: OmpA family protein [Prevotellaceae bacterium]|nr:OmpA family protein [Prevotellaceae bacterium]
MKKSIVLLVASVLFTSILFGQNTKKADKAFEGSKYYEAIQEYTLVENKITDQALLSHVTYRIAECYRRMNQPDKADPYYVKAIKGGYMSPDVYFGYGEVLLKQAKYEEAKKQFESFKRSNPENKLVDAKIASCVFAKAHQMENPKFKLQPMETLNSKGSEYGIAYFNDNLIYASTGNPVEAGSKQVDISPRTGLPYSKFYMSVALDNSYNKGELTLGLNKKDKVNEGTFAYDPTNNRGYYTRCEASKDQQCYIYFAEFINNQWKEIDNLKIENRKQPIGHPFVMPNGRRIYFVATMEGGYGKSDIWYTDKLPDETWSKPINLGREVNTSGSEMFPFVAGEYLFFSSDGHPGYGGTDIFASKIDGNIHGTAINLGLPFNSSQDDVNLIEKHDLSEGMLVSSRRLANNDDIFRFEGYPSSLTASGKIYDSILNRPIVGASIEVKKSGKVVEKLTSDDSGRYVFYIDPDSSKYELSSTVLRYNPVARTYTSVKERFAALDDWNLPLFSSDAYISGIVTGYERIVVRGRKGRTEEIKNLGPIAGATVIVYEGGKQIKVIETTAKGEFRFGDVKENTRYDVKGTFGNGDVYFQDDKTLEVGEITQSIEFCTASGFNMDLALEKIPDKIDVDKIFYDTNKADLRPESLVELEKVVALLEKNNTLKIEIRSHTDSRGSVKANQVLSEKRAASVVKYLITRGIPEARLSYKGYGESQLLIKPDKTDIEQQANRRTEFTVIGTTGEQLYDTRMAVTQSLVGAGVRQIQEDYPAGQYPAAGQYPQQQAPQYPQTTTVPTTGANVRSLPFRIQVAATKTPTNISSNAEFIKIKQQFNLDVYEELSGGVYRYFAGGFNTIAEAKAMCEKLNRALGKEYFPRGK